MQVFRSLEEVPAELGPTVVSVGNFDGVHRAHQEVVRRMADRAHALGGKAVVVTFEPHPYRILRPDVAPKLLTPLPIKLRLLEQTRVDAVLVLPFTRDLSLMSAHDFAKTVLVDALHAREVHEGYNFHFGHKAQGNVNTLADLGKEFGFEAVIYPEQLLRGHHVSSSEIRKLIAEGKMAKARALLGRPFSIFSNPGRGRGYGHKYTVPTVNLARYDELVPADRRLHHLAARRRRMFRGGDQRGQSSNLWGGLLRHRKPPAELPSHRVAAGDRVGTDFPAAAAAGDQVSVGGSAARADRQGRAQGETVFSAAEGDKRVAGSILLTGIPERFQRHCILPAR